MYEAHGYQVKFIVDCILLFIFTNPFADQAGRFAHTLFGILPYLKGILPVGDGAKRTVTVMGGRVKGSGGSFQGKSRTIKASEAAASPEGGDIRCVAVPARKAPRRIDRL
jgi:hypothetical protein